MILSLYANKSELFLPNINLNENKKYEIGILHIGGFFSSQAATPEIFEVRYNGIQAMSGPNPYTILLYMARLGFTYAPGKIIYFPLRTNQLSTTYFKFNVLNAANEFLRVFIQIEIREQNDEN